MLDLEKNEKFQCTLPEISEVAKLATLDLLPETSHPPFRAQLDRPYWLFMVHLIRNKLLYNRDPQCRKKSRSLQIYQHIALQNGTQSHLLQLLPMFFKRIFAEFRLLNRHVSKIYIENQTFDVALGSEMCAFCKLEF